MILDAVAKDDRSGTNADFSIYLFDTLTKKAMINECVHQCLLYIITEYDMLTTTPIQSCSTEEDMRTTLNINIEMLDVTISINQRGLGRQMNVHQRAPR